MDFPFARMAQVICIFFAGFYYLYGNPEKETFPLFKSTLREEFDAVTERVRALETKLKSIEELKKKETVQVVFSVAVGQGNTGYGYYNTDKNVIFKRVITNIGNAYSNVSGIFAAPYAGIYYFVFFHHAGGKSGTNLYLYKKGERIVQAQNHPSFFEKAYNGGNAAFLQLQEKDEVYISLDKDKHVWASDYHTTFSGFLVKRTEDETTESLS